MANENFDQDLLDKTALALYIQMVSRGSLDGYEQEAAALKAFQRANSYLKVRAKIMDGDLSPEAPIAPSPRTVEVEVWDAVDNDKWQPRIDEKTGRVVTMEEPVDHFAFAPNLPPEHPINRRCGMKLGVDPKTGKTVPVG